MHEVLSCLGVHPDGCYVDCTLGGGGHASAIYRSLETGGLLIGIDQDQDALTAAEKSLSELPVKAGRKLVHARFSELADVLTNLDINQVDGILADLGVSSWHLDQAERGFSYQSDGPLDMRMDASGLLTAETIVNTWTQQNLAKILKTYGEERYAMRISQAIVLKREQKPIRSTAELADIIRSAMPAAARREKQHPAKRSFQALRNAVNDELAELETLLRDAPKLLKNGGRFCVISFHSLEDRMVKQGFRELENPCICPKTFPVCTCGRQPLGRVITRKPILADETEVQINPRARSARLRCFERIMQQPAEQDGGSLNV